MDSLFREWLDKVNEGQENSFLQIEESVRHPLRQASFFKYCHSPERIEKAVSFLKKEGAFYLEELLLTADPLEPFHHEIKLPGDSTHQYGLAVDVVWILNGEKELREFWGGHHNLYQRAKIIGEDFDIQPGRCYRHFTVSKRSPSEILSWKKIDNLMQERFSNN